MHINKISITGILLLGLVLTNLNYINAESELSLKDNTTKSNVETYNTSNYKKVELNKTYKHEIRYEPYDNSYDENLYIEFKLEEDGVIEFTKSNIDIDVASERYTFELGKVINNNCYEIRSWGLYENSYKIGLSKGLYRMVLEPDFYVSEDASISFNVKFTKNDAYEKEDNDSNFNPNMISLNKEYMANYDAPNDYYDYYKFTNNLKRDVLLRVKNNEDDILNNYTQDFNLLKLNYTQGVSYTDMGRFNTKDMIKNGDYFEYNFTRLAKGDYIIGINKANESKLKEYSFELIADELSDIDEIKGKDRYETAGLIADEQEYDTAILVNSTKSLADGLSASGLSGAVNAPILLTTKDSIPEYTLKRLEGVKKVYLIGNENAISTTLEEDLKLEGIEVKRLGGIDRYQTSYEVAKEIASIKEIDKILLVNGYKGEPDAMSVSPVASRDGVPIILTNGDDIPFKTNGVDTYIIGSTNVMSKKIEDKTNATRLGGIDRFDTNKKIIKHFYGQPTEFYLSKSEQLVDALTGSPLAKNAPIVLVNNISDKTILEGAKKVTALGGIDKEVIEQCINAANGIK